MSLTSFVSSLFSTVYADAPEEEPKAEETPEASEAEAEEEEPEPEDVSIPLPPISFCVRRGLLTDVGRSVASPDPGGMPEQCSVRSPYEALLALPGEGQ